MRVKWVGIILFFCSLVVTVLLCEIGLRLMDVSYPNFYTHDFLTGAALRPEAEGWWRKEGEAYIKINAQGLRDRLHTQEKPEGTFRIAILGDSYAEALQVAIKDTFWSVLEQELGNCNLTTKQRFEVMNFGVSGFGTAQELVMLRSRVWQYSPDLVILAFTTGNDIRNNLRALEGDPFRPYFVLRDGNLVLDATFRDVAGFQIRRHWSMRIIYSLLNYSRVLQLLNEGKYQLKDFALKALQSKPSLDLSGTEIGLDDMVYFDPKDQFWEEAWRVSEALLRLMKKEVEEKGSTFFVVTLSNSIQVHYDSEYRKIYKNQFGIKDLFYPDRRIQALGKEEGLWVLNLSPLFLDYAENKKRFLHGFHNVSLGQGHWNVDGHRLAGALIAKEVCTELFNTSSKI